MNALVTGGAGFTGGRLCRKLVSDGCRVRTLVLPGSDTSTLRSFGVEVVVGDLTKKETLPTAVDGMDTVFHIAAVYREENVPRSAFWDVNVNGTRNLLECAREAMVKRFVHTSTVGVQGEIHLPPAAEEVPYAPGDYYQESKMEGEILALRFQKEEGLPVVVVRPVGIYGPGDTRFLKLFRFIQSGKFRMFGSGEVLYHLTFIDDLIDGFCLAGSVPGIDGEVFTLAGERYTTLNELVRTVADTLHASVSTRHYPVWPALAAGAVCEWVCRPLRISPPIYRRRMDFFIKDRAFDIGKAKRLLGYRPQIDLRTGIARTADWYKNQGLLKWI